MKYCRGAGMNRELFHELALKSQGRAILDTYLDEITKLRAELSACQSDANAWQKSVLEQGEVIESLRLQLADSEAERNAFQNQCILRKRELADAQADNLWMREVLENAKIAMQDIGAARYHYDIVMKALATQPGDMTALREWGARLLEEVARCAYVTNTGYIDVRFLKGTIAEKLRLGEWAPECLK